MTEAITARGVKKDRQDPGASVLWCPWTSALRDEMQLEGLCHLFLFQNSTFTFF